MLVRPAVLSDVPDIVWLIGEIYAEYACILNIDEEQHLLDPQQYFRSSGGEFWVLEHDELIQATVAVLLHPAAAELKSLYVHGALRRQGWGRRLVQMAIAHAHAAGRSHIFLWSDTRFTAAHCLYRTLGFRQMGTRDLHDSNQSSEYGFEHCLIQE